MTHVRVATVDDAEVIADINVRSWRHAYRGLIPESYLASLDQEAIAKRVRSVALSGADVLLVAERPDVRGFCWMSGSRDEDAAADTAETIAIYVDPAFERRGVGRALLVAVCDAARSRGFETITLWVLAENAAGRAFYEAFGFVADGSTKTTNRWGGVPAREVRYARASRSR